MLLKIQKYLPLVSLVLGLLLLFSAFLTALSSNDEAIMTGITAIFGGNIVDAGIFGSAKVNFSFLNFLAFFLPALVAIVIAVYGMVNQKPNMAKSVLGLILVVAFVLSVIFISSLPVNTTATLSTFLGDGSMNYDGASLGIGSILGLVFSIFGAISTILYSILQFAKE